MAGVLEVTSDRPHTDPSPARPGLPEGIVVMVTGATGFVGSHVVAGLTSGGIDVVAVSRNLEDQDNVVPTPPVRSVAGDLTDPGFVHELIGSTRPDIVLHLAAVTRPDRTEVAVAGSSGLGGYGGTLQATSNLVEALIATSPTTRLVLLSSSAVYGQPASLPIDEQAEVRPVTAYGVSKAAQELVARRAHWAGALQVVVLRAFNLIGPGMPDNLLLGNVALQLIGGADGDHPMLEVGNLESRRDYLDVRDVAAALITVAAHPDPPDLANVASGHSWSGKEVVDKMVAIGGRAVEIRQTSARRQANDVLEQIGDARRLRSSTGWTPHFDIDRSLRDMLQTGTPTRDERSTCS